MKRVKVILLIILVVTALLWGVSEMIPGPEETLEEFVESTNNKDYFALIECFDSVSKNAIQAGVKVSEMLTEKVINEAVRFLTGAELDFEIDGEEIMKLAPFLEIIYENEYSIIEIEIISVDYQGGIYEKIKKIFSIENSNLGKLLADSAVVEVVFTKDGQIYEGPLHMKREGITKWVIDFFYEFKINYQKEQ